ncbi:MAG: hypothetical protein KatS3mg129_1871 [Leptospiraceae bacterium]|nr:MAG: hypothetical protein KatS3mg129_1871 [Leptospiraceae bacterium]
MKLRIFKVLFISTFVLGSILNFSNIEAQENKGSIQIDLNLVSNYVWRGHDFFRNYAIQNWKQYGPHSGIWAFQPSITWNTPVNGLYVNLFSSLALQGREDKDIDKRIQTQPGGAFIQNRTSLLDYKDPSLNLEQDIKSSLPTSNQVSDYQNIPNFYKEQVGLKRSDELDITIGYESDTNVGIIGFGILHYSYANVTQVNTAYGTEVFITYAFPFLKELRFSIYEDLQIHTIYYNISYGGEYQLTNELTSSYNISSGYYVLDNVQGVSDITLNYTISHSSGFSFGINIAYRPDLWIQDYYFGSGDLITGEVNNTKLPIDINGQSTIYDGQVADPSLSLGPINEYVNNQISQLVTNTTGIPFTYTPRQKLPKYLWWISLGYSITIE